MRFSLYRMVLVDNHQNQEQWCISQRIGLPQDCEVPQSVQDALQVNIIVEAVYTPTIETVGIVHSDDIMKYIHKKKQLLKLIVNGLL